MDDGGSADVQFEKNTGGLAYPQMTSKGVNCECLRDFHLPPSLLSFHQMFKKFNKMSAPLYVRLCRSVPQGETPVHAAEDESDFLRRPQMVLVFHRITNLIACLSVRTWID